MSGQENDLIDFSVYNLKSGEITKTGQVHDMEHVAINIGDGEAAVVGYVDPLKNRIVRGKVIPYTAAQVAARVEQPALGFAWNHDRLMWEDTRTLAEAKADEDRAVIAKMSELELKQDRAVREAVLTGDHTKLNELNDQITALRNQLHPKE